MYFQLELTRSNYQFLMAKKQDPLSPERQKQYERLIELVPELEVVSRFGFPYTSINGHMFSFMAKTGSVGIRLPKNEREQFLEKFNTVLFHNHNGPVLKEYVQVPDELLETPEVLKPYLEMSLAFVKTLKPKPVKKK